MATEELIKRSIVAGKPYNSLPERIRLAVSLNDWKTRVKENSLQRGLNWADSLAKEACMEGEYYEDLISYYKTHYRIFPYHLAENLCRHMRVTPFKYYTELLINVIRDEKSYDFLPNFTAKDIVRLIGVGRNEYISIMNKCKSKKLLWRMNRSVVKEMLPTEPLDFDMQPWWTVNVVNLSEAEYKAMSEVDTEICHRACQPEGLTVQEVDRAALQRLYKLGFVYVGVPIHPTDHVSIPPLEGFVSNKDSEKGEDRGDPQESILYAVFLATSEQTSVAELSNILNVDQARLQAAVSFACRLGFATRLPPQSGDSFLYSPRTTAGTPEEQNNEDRINSGSQASTRGSENSESKGSAIALVVDTEVTSYLMMGALSPGLKKHSVSLFEGGRVSGVEVIEELIQELRASVQAASEFEGEIQMLAGYAKSLAAALECLRVAGSGRTIELLRKETLANLAPDAATRVLSHAYAAVVPVTPLPSPPLPLNPSRPGPTNFGATMEASKPWLQLALYKAAGLSPPTLVLLAGQVFWRLPAQLQGCSHALFWPWDAESVRAQVVPVLIEAKFLLFSLNEYLSRTALIVQPLLLPPNSTLGDLPTACLPLPLERARNSESDCLVAYDSETGDSLECRGLRHALQDVVSNLGLSNAVGYISILQVGGSSNSNTNDNTQESSETGSWLPLSLHLGVPLRPDTLCQAVCSLAEERNFLAADNLAKHRVGQDKLQQYLFSVISEFGACTTMLAPAVDDPQQALGYVDLPIYNLAVQGSDMKRIDLSKSLQGRGYLCID